MIQRQNVLITGASGLVGSALAKALDPKKYQVFSLTRKVDTESRPRYFNYCPLSKKITLDPTVKLDAVVNLAGPSIAEKRWTTKRKLLIKESRVDLTAALAFAIAKLESPPKLFLSASAVGFYGATARNPCNEESQCGTDFLSEVAVAWECATKEAQDAGINTIHLRFGVILSEKGGVLGKLLLPFRLGLGGPIGSGDQMLSWISLPDVVAVIKKLLRENPICGPLNLVSPNPISSKIFANQLGSALKRPSFLPLPAFAVKILLGEMGEALLLANSNVVSSKLGSVASPLSHQNIDHAFDALLVN
jgi:hypothetical protein